ncbi:PREDICTED: partner of Y14 and mago [Nicrophorus vespilloides]|uniref:Partner of Y14 and mago n=1 Tax=Nicrophorus vespilloides TaxID=110193 RepID=A0ABM1MJ84_NICVS|nr:PREDICTED: partner of Y14 and mago [Nicrophorus vespilloides]
MQSNDALRDSDPLANGESFIPASQRPDGTWRKPRRVKEGYVPQEEVPLYESKGKKLMNRHVAPAEPMKVAGFTAHKTIPGLFIEDKPAVKTPKPKKTKAKKVDVVTSLVSELKITEQPKKQVTVSSPAVTVAVSESSDPVKKVKNLKKRLREVESLEEKINSGAIAKPEKEQLDKIKRKNDLIMQIYQLEKEI